MSSIACVDGLNGFPEDIETVYPQAEVQPYIVHLVRNSPKYVSWKQRKAVADDLKAIYKVATIEEAELALDTFADTWDSQSRPSATSGESSGSNSLVSLPIRKRFAK